MAHAKSLQKLQKSLKSASKKPTIHPKGRKFQQLARATLREQKLTAKKKAHNERRSNELARIKFIQDVINSPSFKERSTFEPAETAVFIRQFIDRDDEELNALIARRRSDRPPSGKQQLLQSKKNLELEEFRKGFLCPDLSDVDNVKFLRAWNGSFGSMSTLKLVRINEEGVEVVSGTKTSGTTSSAGDNKDVDMEGQ